jgi:hypothetical protein
MRFVFVLGVLGWVAVTLGCAPPEPVLLPVRAVTPEDPKHLEARQRLLAALTRVQREGQLLVGQQLGVADSPEGGWLRDSSLKQVGSVEVALIGMDFGYEDLSSVRDDALDQLTAHFRRGGLVTVNVTPRNPATLGDAKDTRFTASDYDALADPSSQVGRRWATYVSNLGNHLQRLKDDGVIVLFRPLHEMNGGWFWWGSEKEPPSAERFRTLWRALHQTLTVERKLDNLVWVYSPNATFADGMPATDFYYPGDDVVDLVGQDLYADTFDDFDRNESWSRLARLGKPLAVCELGPANNGPLQRQGTYDFRTVLALHAQRPFAYVLAWNSFPGAVNALNQTPHGEAFMKSPNVLNLATFRW